MTKGKWSEKVLYAFCEEGGLICTDGQSPSAGLTMDAAGDLYGVTWLGGAGSIDDGSGVVFKLAPQEGLTKWSESVLHTFCTVPPNCSDGRRPYTRLVVDANGDIFGATGSGGNSQYAPGVVGVIFEITPDSSEIVLYTFCSTGELCQDGAQPEDTGGLLLDTSGNLFGTTSSGGAYQDGELFELDHGSKSLRVLHSFCSAGTPCPDGIYPESGVIQSTSGRLYGTTSGGGSDDGFAGGTVFEIKP